MDMRLKLMAAGAAFGLTVASAALAQTSGQRVIIESGTSPQRQEGSVRVQSSLNVFLPGPTSEGEEAQKLRERAKRIVYELAGRECDLLRDVLAKDCRLESVNNNVTTQRGTQQEGYTVNGQMSLVITLK
jgi:hypothetical protein